MFNTGVRKKTLKIVLTNDDGIDAPGLDALRSCFDQQADIIVVAPLNAQSGIAHRVTIRQPLRLNQLRSDRYSVDGTPADCARIALTRIVLVPQPYSAASSCRV